MSVIQIKRGLSANINNASLLPGELAVTLDTYDLYVGNNDGEIKKIGNGYSKEEVDAKIAEVKENIENSSSVTPDWNASAGNGGYILNRTHYTEFAGDTILNKPGSQNFYGNKGLNGLCWAVAQYSAIDMSNVELASVFVTGNGNYSYEGLQKHVLEVEENGEMINVYYFGNPAAVSSFSPYEGMEDDGEEIAILVDNDSIMVCIRVGEDQIPANGMSIFLFRDLRIDTVSERVVKLDNKYLQILNDEAVSNETGWSSNKISTLLEDKQDKLTPGENITIEDNVISAVGGATPATATDEEIGNLFN